MPRPVRGVGATRKPALAPHSEAEEPRRRKLPVGSDAARKDATTADAAVEIRSRDDLRQWLAANHETSPSVWLVTFKRHHEHYVPYATFVEELLCWGWVDSVKRAVDEDRVSCRISRRNPRSAWSAINKAHVLRARDSGAMTSAGEAAIAAALANGAWAELDAVDAGVVPPDLHEALSASGAAAQRFWESQPRGVQWIALRWLMSAKTPETRSRRIADIVDSAAAGLRPTPQRRR